MNPGWEDNDPSSFSKFEIGVFIPESDVDDEERLRVGMITPDELAGLNGLKRDAAGYVSPKYARLVVEPLEFDCFDRPSPDWWINSSVLRSWGKKYLGFSTTIEVVSGVGAGARRSRDFMGDSTYAPILLPPEYDEEAAVSDVILSLSDSSSSDRQAYLL
jgi:hypothetical protein